jgi:hypothetical protein
MRQPCGLPDLSLWKSVKKRDDVKWITVTSRKIIE